MSRDRVLYWSEVAERDAAGICPASGDDDLPHRPDDTTDPLTCAECGAIIESEGEA